MEPDHVVTDDVNEALHSEHLLNTRLYGNVEDGQMVVGFLHAVQSSAGVWL